jgi:hypothetical protein
MGTITKNYIIIILFEKIIMKKECQDIPYTTNVGLFIRVKSNADKIELRNSTNAFELPVSTSLMVIFAT